MLGLLEGVVEGRRVGLASTNTLLCCAERKTWQKEQWKKIRCRFPGIFESCNSSGRRCWALQRTADLVREEEWSPFPALSNTVLAVLASAMPKLCGLPHRWDRFQHSPMATDCCCLEPEPPCHPRQGPWFVTKKCSLNPRGHTWAGRSVPGLL